MLPRKYDPTLPYRYARYGRMSDPTQNKRSPDQQFTTVEETRGRNSYPWVQVRTYRDDGISGRLVRKRPGFQQMLRDIESGLINIDLIAVDTYERLGRAEEVDFLRHKLFTQYGILVVAADNNFADPTGVVGKAVGMVESIRATEHSRISRHNVIRGKRDAARLGRWPGGPAPFGFSLKAVIDQSSTPAEVYHVLEPEPRERAAMQLAFERAAATGHGDLRLARWWNGEPAIPDEYKPISPFTMGYRLSNPISVGILRWGEHRTAVVNDTRIMERNPENEVLYVPDFCPALTSTELFDRVQGLRAARARATQDSRQKAQANGPPKLIAPQGRGLTLRYLLTGLVRCANCQASMRPVPSGRRSKGGRRYVYYTCPRHYEGACLNRRHFPEDELREATVARVRARLFPPPEQTGQVPAWLPEMRALVQQGLQRYREGEPDRAAAAEQELRELSRQLAGWTMTLAEPSLSPLVRADIVVRYEQAKQRQQQLEQGLASQRALQQHVEQMLQPHVVVERLHKLGTVLGGNNPTLGNLELSRHIEKISCHPDGRVELRGTLLGVFEGAVELLSRPEAPASDGPETAPGGYGQVKPRRRGGLHVPNLSADSQTLVGEVDASLDPERFAGLPEPFFWTEVFVLPRKMSWAEEHAAEVAQLRGTGLTMEQLAAHFGKTVPTVRDALQRAAAKEESVARLPKKMPRRRWAEEHATEVAQLKAQGLSILAIARRLGKSDPTIRAALRYAQGQVPPLPTTDNGAAGVDGNNV